MSMQQKIYLTALTVLVSSVFTCVSSYGQSEEKPCPVKAAPEKAAEKPCDVKNEKGKKPKAKPKQPKPCQESFPDRDAPDRGHKVPLTETLELTYMQNAELDSARAGLRATVEDVAIANSDWRPSLSVQGQQSQTQRYPIGTTSRNNPSSAKRHGSNTGYTASISQNVYRGGQTTASVERAKQNYFGGAAGLFSTEQDVLFKGIDAHTNILANADKLKYQKQSETFYKERVDQTQVRFEVGEGSRTDVETMKAAYEGAKANVTTATANLESSKATYINQVGSPPGDLSPSTVLLDIPKCYEDALEAAKTKNPLILQARYALEAAKYFINVEMAGLLPVLDVEADVGNTRVGGTGPTLKTTDLSFTTTLNIPLYAQGGRPNAEVRKAYQLLSQSKVDYVNTERQVIENVTTAWDNLIAARDNVKSRIAQVKASELAVEGALAEADVGVKTFIDVRELEEDLLRAQIELVDAQTALITASYDVLRSMGRLTACDLKLNVKYYDPDRYYQEYKNAWIQFWKGKDWSYVTEASQ